MCCGKEGLFKKWRSGFYVTFSNEQDQFQEYRLKHFRQKWRYFGIPVSVTSFCSSFANAPYLAVHWAIPGNYSSEKHARGAPYCERKIHLPACSRSDAYSRRQTVISSCSLQLSSTLPFIVVPLCDSSSTETSVLSLGVIEVCLPFYYCTSFLKKELF